MKSYPLLMAIVLLSGCASLGDAPLNTPPEFHQKIKLIADDQYQMFQAPRSGYDLGDLQSFHSQHTFPMKVEAAFQELFGKVQVLDNEPNVEVAGKEMTPVFEVRMADLSHDLYDESLEYYRGQVTIAAAMKSPRGETVWQEAFRGEGFINVKPEFGMAIGPEEAVVAAVDDAVKQMQDAILKNPQIRLYFKSYAAIEEARRKEEVKV